MLGDCTSLDILRHDDGSQLLFSSVTISALGNGLQWEKALWLLNLVSIELVFSENLIRLAAGQFSLTL